MLISDQGGRQIYNAKLTWKANDLHQNLSVAVRFGCDEQFENFSIRFEHHQLIDAESARQFRHQLRQWAYFKQLATVSQRVSGRQIKSH